MARGKTPSLQKVGAPPNRAERRKATKAEEARLKRITTIHSKRTAKDLKILPQWMKSIIGLVIFASGGGFSILKFIVTESEQDPRVLLLFGPIVGLFIAAFVWWKVSSAKLPKNHKVGLGEKNPLEKVHGKYRLNKALLDMPTTRTAGQMKERRPSKQYTIVPSQPAFVSTSEAGQIGSQPSITGDL